MDTTGLGRRFPVNRPITQDERDRQLRQKQRLDVKLVPGLTVINMNSTYIQCVDRWYGDRGFLAMLGMVCAIFCLYACITLLWLVVSGDVPNEGSLWPVIFVSTGWFAAIGAAAVHLARRELFRWTCYPIILDRKGRMVHVFQLDGTTLSISWDKVFFTMGRGKALGAANWDVRALVLAEDGNTVVNTFAFGVLSDIPEVVQGHWEFLRRYMEEGPASVISTIKFCMPVNGKRESAAVSRERIFANDAQLPASLRAVTSPFNFLHSLARSAVIYTSKIPVWPEEIMRTLPVAADDPYVKDSSINPEDLR